MITELPTCMERMTSLQMLSVGENPLRKLPVELGELPSLHYVNLDGNKMDYPAPELCRKGDQAVVAFLREEWQAAKLERLKHRRAMAELKKLKTHLQPTIRELQAQVSETNEHIEQVD